MNLAADDRAQAGYDIAAEPARAHDNAEHFAKRLSAALSWYVFRRGHKHSIVPSMSAGED
jgi:hypothetical protein